MCVAGHGMPVGRLVESPRLHSVSVYLVLCVPERERKRDRVFHCIPVLFIVSVLYVCLCWSDLYIRISTCMHAYHTYVYPDACMHACIHTYIHTYGVYMVSPRVWPRRTSMRGVLLFQAARTVGFRGNVCHSLKGYSDGPLSGILDTSSKDSSSKDTSSKDTSSKGTSLKATRMVRCLASSAEALLPRDPCLSVLISFCVPAVPVSVAVSMPVVCATRPRGHA